MAAKTPPKPVDLPGVFRASIGYVAVLGIFAIGGGLLMKTVLASHKTQTIEVVGMLTGIFTVLFLVVATSSVKVDEDGIVERSLVGKNVTPWDQVGTVDKMQNRGIALKSAAGRNLTLITLLAANVQDAIADEAIRRGALRQVTDEKAKKKLRGQGIVEQWTK